ncbi:MAG: TadE/TadG family type IV pilus assembly protein [Acidobacteriaceae bacterium]
MPRQSKSAVVVPYELVAPLRCVTDGTLTCGLPQAKVWKAESRRDPRCGEDGSASVEMALSMFILLSVLIGVFEVCLALYSYHYVSEAAREGSRYAIVHGSTCTVSGISCTVTAAQIQSYVQNLGYPGINPSNMIVTTTWSAYPVGESCVAVGCNGPGDLVTVSAQYSFNLAIPFVNRSALSLTSTSSMVISQ